VASNDHQAEPTVLPGAGVTVNFTALPFGAVAGTATAGPVVGASGMRSRAPSSMTQISPQNPSPSAWARKKPVSFGQARQVPSIPGTPAMTGPAAACPAERPGAAGNVAAGSARI